jgi:enoyl-CoA hydratase/carnithine racemase
MTERTGGTGASSSAGVHAQWRVDPGRPDAGPVRLDLTLSRPDRHNALTEADLLALRAVQRDLPGSVRVVVVRGEGRSFCSGVDTAVLDGLAGVIPADDTMGGHQRAFDWSGDAAYISVAAVHGYALGAGLQLALGCDLRIVTADAVLGLPEVGHGLVPDLGGTARLVDAVGYSYALELAATGRRVGGEEAYRIGLAQHLVEPDQLDTEVERLVAALLAPDRDTVREVTALLRRARDGGPGRRAGEDQLTAEREAQRRMLHRAADRDTAGSTSSG